MRFTVKYDKRAIMKKAHKFYRGGKMGDFAECLRKAWENAKTFKGGAEVIGETIHTWYGWTLLGREVRHNEKNVLQLEMWDDTLKNKVKKIVSYFTYEQTCELGTQPPKEN